MLIIPRLFPAVKQPVFLHQFFQIAFPDTVKRHHRIFAVFPVCFHHEPDDYIQIRFGQALYCKDCSGMFFIDQQNIRLHDGLFSIKYEQLHILRVALPDVLHPFFCDHNFFRPQFTEVSLQERRFNFA